MILINKNTVNQKDIRKKDRNELKNINVNVDYDKVKSGMCGTMHVGSDSYAMVVVKRLTPKSILVSYLADEDLARTEFDENNVEVLPDKYLDNYKNIQGYYLPTKFKFRKNGRWIREGFSLHGTGGLHIGRAENYRDPSF